MTEAIDLLKRAQHMLAQSNLRLHKVASNSPDVMRAQAGLPTHTAQSRTRMGPVRRHIQISSGYQPVLSTINSLYAHLGFAAPVSIQGRSILRDITSNACDWAAPLPKESHEKWQRWRDSLQDLRELKIPRMYTSLPLSAAQRREMCIFCPPKW